MDPAQPRLLLTGFEPFGGESQNPSAEVVRALHGRTVGAVQVVSLVLPCVFGQSLSWLRAALAEHRPLLVLALGQAAGQAELAIERVAINLDDARVADNAGAQPIDEAVVRGAPAAYFSTLPIKAMAAALQQAGFPAAVSHSAGTFVCNHVFYGLQHALAGSGVRSGFMHLPLLPEQAARLGGGPSLPLQTQMAGVALALHVALHTREDARHSTGTLS
jgi:pyroglutamyl-peptidase